MSNFDLDAHLAEIKRFNQERKIREERLKHEFYLKIGKLLKEHRLKKGLSQFEVETALNLNTNELTVYENAKTKISLHRYLKLCKFLEIEFPPQIDAEE